MGANSSSALGCCCSRDGDDFPQSSDCARRASRLVTSRTSWPSDHKCALDETWSDSVLESIPKAQMFAMASSSQGSSSSRVVVAAANRLSLFGMETPAISSPKSSSASGSLKPLVHSRPIDMKDYESLACLVFMPQQTRLVGCVRILGSPRSAVVTPSVTPERSPQLSPAASVSPMPRPSLSNMQGSDLGTPETPAADLGIPQPKVSGALDTITALDFNASQTQASDKVRAVPTPPVAPSPRVAAPSQKLKRIPTFNMHEERKRKVAVDHDSFQVEDDGGWGVLRVWSSDTGKLKVQRVLAEHCGIPSCMAVCGDALYVGEIHGFVSLYEIGYFSISLCHRVDMQAGPIRALDADEIHVYVAAGPTAIPMWDAELTNKIATFDLCGGGSSAELQAITGVLRPCWLPIPKLKKRSPFYVQALSVDGQGWLLGLEYGSVDCNEISARAHDGRITAAAVSIPNGTGLVMTAGIDRFLCIWCAATLAPVHRVHVGEDHIIQLSCTSPSEFTSLAANGELKSWRVSSSHVPDSAIDFYET